MNADEVFSRLVEFAKLVQDTRERLRGDAYDVPELQVSIHGTSVMMGSDTNSFIVGVDTPDRRQDNRFSSITEGVAIDMYMLFPINVLRIVMSHTNFYIGCNMIEDIDIGIVKEPTDIGADIYEVFAVMTLRLNNGIEVNVSASLGFHYYPFPS